VEHALEEEGCGGIRDHEADLRVHRRMRTEGAILDKNVLAISQETANLQKQRSIYRFPIQQVLAERGHLFGDLLPCILIDDLGPLWHKHEILGRAVILGRARRRRQHKVVGEGAFLSGNADVERLILICGRGC